MRSCQDAGVIIRKNLLKINACCFFEVRIQKGDLFQRNSVPEINDQSLLTKTGTISRKTGGSEPDTGTQCTADSLHAFSLNKILCAVFFRKTVTKHRIIDHKKWRDRRQMFSDIFKKITGIVIVVAVVCRRKHPGIRI